MLSKIEPQFICIPDAVRLGGNTDVLAFLWGNMAHEVRLIHQHKMGLWLAETLMVCCSALQCVAVVLQCVAVVLQCVAVTDSSAQDGRLAC